MKSIATLGSLSDTHQMLQKTCRDFADKELIPNAKIYDQQHLFPAKSIQDMGKLGLMAVAISEEFG